jgi:hypothetical protein
MNPLEKQLQSWMPRRPSADLARKIFAGAVPAPVFLRPAEVWHWLTPVAACVLALMVAVNSGSRHSPRLSRPDNATFFATTFFNASNAQKTFALSKLDENVEWNVWPHPFTAQAIRWSAMPTNR